MEIGEDEFCRMKPRDQNRVLFRNIKEIKGLIEGYKFYYKITAVIGGILAVGMGILFKLQLFR